MLYGEYLECAKKHLKSCQAIIDNYSSDTNRDFEVLLDTYYISGYIMEGLTVYLAYKCYNWPNDKNIDDPYYFNDNFWDETQLDYFHYRKSGIGYGCDNPGLCVMHHGFQEIAHYLLINQKSFINDNSTPYYGNGTIDVDVKLLIDLWTPKIRYYHKMDPRIQRIPTLNKDLLTRLINTCSIVFRQVICRVGL